MIDLCRPSQPLRRYVRYYHQFRDRLVAHSLLQPVAARSSQALEFMFGTPFRVQKIEADEIDEAHQVTLIGAQTHRRVNLLLSGTVDAFTIIFEPGGLSALFPVSAGDLSDRHIDAWSLLGPDLPCFYEELATNRSFGSRVAAIDQLLGARLGGSTLVNSVAWAAGRLHNTAGRMTVTRLASESDLSVRQFERRFRDEIGMSPRLYARVVRFESALRIKTAKPEKRWTEIAHALGYFDQMHMVHDFKRLSGASPSMIGNQLDMFVRPEILAARS